MIESHGKNLIFILSTPRAGSTLLGSLLGNQGKTLCPSEPWLLVALEAIRSRQIAVISPADHEQARAAIEQLVEPGILTHSERVFVLNVYNTLLKKAGKEVFVDKTPRYYHTLLTIDRLFPEAKKIWIRRNPFDTIASCKQTWQLSVDEILGEPVSPYSFDATVSFPLLADYFDASSDNKYVVDYEELSAEPEKVMRAVCKFAELKYDEHIVDYGENKDLMNMHAQNTMGDKKILEHKRPHADSVGKWKETLEPREVARILKVFGRALLKRLDCGDMIKDAAEFAKIDPKEISDKGTMDRLFHELAIYGDQKLIDAKTVHHSLASRQNAQMRHHIEALRIDYDKRLQVILDQQKTVASLQDSVGKLTRQLEEVSADYDKRLQVILQQQHTIAELQVKHSAAESSLKSREEALHKQQLTGAELGRDLGELRAKFGASESSLVSQKEETAMQQQAAAALARQLGELRAELDGRQRQLHDYQQKLSEQQSTIAQREALHQADQSNLQLLQMTVTEQKRLASDVSTRLDALRVDYDKQSKVVLEMQTTGSAYAQQVQNLQQTIATLQTQLQDRDSKIASLEAGLMFRLRRLLKHEE